MPSVLEAAPESVLAAQIKPLLTSYDSGAESSIDHWLAVHQMVEAEALLYGESAGRALDGELCLGAW